MNYATSATRPTTPGVYAVRPATYSIKMMVAMIVPQRFNHKMTTIFSWSVVIGILLLFLGAILTVFGSEATGNTQLIGFGCMGGGFILPSIVGFLRHMLKTDSVIKVK